MSAIRIWLEGGKWNQLRTQRDAEIVVRLHQNQIIKEVITTLTDIRFLLENRPTGWRDTLTGTNKHWCEDIIVTWCYRSQSSWNVSFSFRAFVWGISLQIKHLKRLSGLLQEY